MQSRRQFFVGDRGFTHRGKIWFQAIEERALAGKRTFLGEAIESLAQKRSGPFAFVNMIGIPFRPSIYLRLHFSNCLVIQLFRNYSATTRFARDRDRACSPQNA